MNLIRGSATLFIAIVMVIGLCAVGVSGQKKKRRSRPAPRPAAPKPVITNPTIAPPTTTESNGDVKIISTADQTTEESKPESADAKPKPSSEEKEMKQTISNLSNQVDRLNDRLSSMQEDDRYQLDMERLTRAEQRSEQVRGQLIDTQSRMADLEAKLEQVEYNLKPENIERVTQGMGTLRPEDARESRKKQLENEKMRLQAQLKILESSKTRLETSLATADAEVDTLRAKMDQRRQQMDATPPVTEGRPKKP